MKTLVLVVDTREQKPFWTGSECYKKPLIIGDYTTHELEGRYHIERKSPADLYGTITTGHRRFRDEIVRAWDNKVRFSVFVECSREDFVAKNFGGGSRLKVKPEQLDKIIVTMEKRYKLEFVWHKNRTHCKKAAYDRLFMEQMLLFKKKKIVPIRIPRSTISSARVKSVKEKLRKKK